MFINLSIFGIYGKKSAFDHFLKFALIGEFQIHAMHFYSDSAEGHLKNILRVPNRKIGNEIFKNNNHLRA
jgi:hypothetical protein